jgi:hypothetical protein
VNPKDNTTLPVTISLTPISTPSTVSNGGVGLGPILVVGAVAVVGVVAYLSLGRLRTSTPEAGPKPARRSEKTPSEMRGVE